MSKRSCVAAESIEDAIHDNRMFAKRAFYCIANGAGNCNIFTSGITWEGQHHHDFVRVASIRELEGIGHSADLLKSQLLI